MNKTPTHIYYNVRIQNNDTEGRDKIAEYREQKTIPILTNPSDYYMSCIRFTVPTSRIPLLIVPIKPYPNLDATKTIYSLTLSYNGVDVTQNVTWVPNETYHDLYSQPIQPKLSLSVNNKYTNPKDSYYYCRSYTHFMNLVNATFATAFYQLSQQTILPAGSQPPFYVFDSTTQLFYLHAQKDFYDVASANPIKIFYNNDLYALFGNVNSVLYQYPNNEKHRQILISADVNDINVDADGYIAFAQEYPSLVSWIGFTSIVVTTGTIPIIAESIPTTTPIFSNTNQLNDGKPSYLNIIADYEVQFEAGHQDFQSVIQYSPTNEYKMIDLTSTQPLTSFDLQVFWSDVYTGSNLHPVYIAANETCSFKFLFRSRNYSLVK
jgi:hypothetical protein